MREKKAASLSHGCSSGPADPLLPTELLCRSVGVKGSKKGRMLSLQTVVWDAVGFIREKVFPLPESSVNVTWREPEAITLSEKVTCLPRRFSEVAGNFSQIPTWLFLSLYPQVQF